MYRLLHYFGRAQAVKGSVGQLPGWARLILAVLASPGIVLIGLSMLAFGVSLLALLLLTVPAYRVLAALRGFSGPPISAESAQAVPDAVASEATIEPEPRPQGRRHVEVTIIE